VSTTEIDLEAQLGAAADEDEQQRRLLLLVNPYATSVSARLRTLVSHALRGRYLVDAVDTERRDHATALCREAASEGYDAIVAFGGDGTINEAANGLIGSRTPLTCLPGGRANVFCRMLGIPADVIDATEHLLSLADRWPTRPIDLGRVGERCFLFSAGLGLDASVVAKVDAHPRLKARLGEYYYAWVATTTYARRYLLKPPRMRATLSSSESVDGVTVVVQNAAPYTYFGDRGVEMGEGAALDSGDLAGLVLKRTSPLDVPSIAWRALSARARIVGHRQVRAFSAQTSIAVGSLDERPLPLQVDGDYIGTVERAEFTVLPGAIDVIA
jgi:diacylglycerol kinase family enzyme